MIICQSECDCGAPGGYPHEPDCRSFRKCDWDGEGAYCDAHFEEAAMENARVLRTPIGQTEAEMRQDLIDSGRGHLVPDYLADRIDMARMRMKDERE